MSYVDVFMVAALSVALIVPMLVGLAIVIAVIRYLRKKYFLF